MRAFSHSEGLFFAPTDDVPFESDANNAQFWIVKMVLTLLLLLFFKTI